jgi:hypothetical protein
LQLLTHRARCTGWAEHAAAWADVLRAVRAPLPPPSPNARLTVVFPQHSRLANAELAAWLALASPEVARVVVVNDNPAERLSRWISFEDPRLKLIDHEMAVGPVCRYFTAREQPGDLFLSVDDDLFLAPGQIGALAAALEAEPDRAHGLYGQHYLGPEELSRNRSERRRAGACPPPRHGDFATPHEKGFTDNVLRCDGEVDVLNRAYAFTRGHLETYLRLLDTLGIHSPEALMELDDDIPLSFVGQRRPRCHDLGAFCDCPSEHSSSGARWRRDRAAALRLNLFERLRALQRPTAPSGEPARAPLPVWPRSLWWTAALLPTGLPLLEPALRWARKATRG